VTKRRLALAFVGVLLALVAGSMAALRTRWVAERICSLAAARVGAATGLEVATSSCRIDPFTLTVVTEGLRLGPAGAPLFTAEAIEARPALIQGLGGRLELAALRLTRPRLVVAVPPGPEAPRACPPPALGQIDIGRLDLTDGSVELSLAGGGRVAVDGLHVEAGRIARSRWRLGRSGRRVQVTAGALEVRVAAAGQAWRLVRPVVDGEVALDLSEATVASAEAVVDGVRLAVRGQVQTLCRPQLDLTVTAEGSLARMVALAGESAKEWDAQLKVQARVKGRPSAPQLSASVDFARLGAGEIRLGAGSGEARLVGDKVVVDRLTLPFGAGKVTARGEVKLRSDVPIEASAELEGVDLAEILERLSVPGAWVTGRLTGTGQVAGTVWPPRLTVTVDSQVRDFRALTVPWRQARPADQAMVEFAEGHLRAPFLITLEGLTFEKARLEVGRGAVEVDAEVHFATERGFQVRASGQVDLGPLGHIAGLPMSGMGSVTARVAAAPYGLPRAEARVKLEQFRFLEVDLGDVSGDLVHAADKVLRFTSLEGRRGGSDYRGWLAVDLGATPVRIAGSRFTASGRARDYLEAVADWLPSSRPLRGIIDGTIEAMTVSASGPAAAPDIRFEGRFGPCQVMGRRFDGGQTSGTIHEAAMVRFDRLELTSGPGTVEAVGTWAFQAPQPWALTLAAKGLPAATLDLPGGAWSGSISGSADLAGSWEQPRVRFALNGDALALRGAVFGTVQLGGTIESKRLLVTGGAEGMRFSAEAQLEGRMPYQARVDLKLEDAARLWPGGPPGGFRAAVEGQATASGDLAEPRTARGRIEVSRLTTTVGDFRVENGAPVALRFDGGRLDVEAFKIVGPDTEFSISGGLGGGRDLDLDAAGTVDLRFMAGLLPALRRPHGRISLQAHVGGTAEALELLGDGVVEEGGFQVRNTNVVFEGLSGALSFSQNRVIFDGAEARVNGGRTTMSGEVELVRMMPSRLRLEAQLEAVPVAIPANLPVTLSGRLEAAGTPEETVVTGRLHVLKARYTDNVDLEKSILELRRRRAAAARAYDKASEWLRFDLQLVVDGDARIENDVARGNLRGELTLVGSLAAPGMLGALTMSEGSRAMFRGNEFTLSHAVVDFTERNRVEMGLDVHGEARVRDYQVFLSVLGSITEPRLTLTSSPPLSQPDIITLLSMGYTSRDTPASSGVQGMATAAAAQALISASGLDDQVRRFMPRGEVLQDLSVRVTSAYSEGAGQVEPRAEFESWLVKDRLKLRFQAPLSGARLGQRAQAELRLGTNTALQYQWDNDNPERQAGDHGLDLRLRWEWNE
jgi:translocation and assembly module TamB